MNFLRQSTTITKQLGPFQDFEDGVTDETALAVVVEISKVGAVYTARNSATAITHDSEGWYRVELDTTDTNTLGELTIKAQDSASHVAVWERFTVIPQVIYDWMINGSSLLGVDVQEISGDATAADNLELMYDGTGYEDATAPASRDQVSNIGTGAGGSINFEAAEDNISGAIIGGIPFVGNVVSGTFLNTQSNDGSLHEINDAGNVIDIVYGYNVGGGRIGTSVQITANVDGNTDQMAVQVYNHVDSIWETVGTVLGAGGSTSFVTIEPPLFAKHTGTGAELGNVYVRFNTLSTTPSTLDVDQCIVSAVNIGQTVGYSGGAIWVDTVGGLAGSEPFVNGTADNPVLTWADALLLSNSIGIHRYVVSAGSSITLTADSSNIEIMGNNYSLDLNGQNIDSSKIEGAAVSGTFTMPTAIFEDCIIEAITGPGVTMRRCFFDEVTITANGVGNWYLNDCRSRVAGTSSPTFDFGVGVGNTGLNLRAYSGGIRIENMGDAGVDSLSMEGDGALTIDANCDGGNIAVRGNIRITDNSGGNPSFAITPDVTGYQEGAVWVDENSGTSSGTVVGLDATFQNQANDFDNGQAVADGLGIAKIVNHPGNSITLTAALTGYTIENVQSTINGGGQNVDATRINGGFITGTFARAGTGVPTFNICSINNLTSDRVAILDSGLIGTMTLTEAGLYVFVNAQAAGPTGVSTIDYASLGGATCNFERWTGNLTINNMAAGDSLNLHCTSGGDIILNGVSGTVNISGVVGSVTDNRTGSPTLNDKSVNLAAINVEVDQSITDAALSTNAQVSALSSALLAELALMQGSGFNTATDSLESLRNRGDSSWITAAGFSTHAAPDLSGVALESSLTEIKGAGFVEATDSLQGIRDRGDSSWITAAGFSTHAAPDLSGVALESSLTEIKGAGFVEATDSLQGIRDRGDAAWVTGGGGTAAGVAEAVWDALLSNHAIAGSAGEAITKAAFQAALSAALSA